MAELVLGAAENDGPIVKEHPVGRAIVPPS